MSQGRCLTMSINILWLAATLSWYFFSFSSNHRGIVQVLRVRWNYLSLEVFEIRYVYESESFQYLCLIPEWSASLQWQRFWRRIDGRNERARSEIPEEEKERPKEPRTEKVRDNEGSIFCTRVASREPTENRMQKNWLCISPVHAKFTWYATLRHVPQFKLCVDTCIIRLLGTHSSCRKGQWTEASGRAHGKPTHRTWGRKYARFNANW